MSHSPSPHMFKDDKLINFFIRKQSNQKWSYFLSVKNLIENLIELKEQTNKLLINKSFFHSFIIEIF